MALDQLHTNETKRKSFIKRKQKDTEKEMSFFDHLEELRWHIIRSLIAIVVIAIVLFLNQDFVFNNIIFGPRHNDFATYKAMCWLGTTLRMPAFCIQPTIVELINTDVGGNFFSSIQVSLLLAFVLSFPYIFWEVWRFIKPGLYNNEQKAASGMVFICSFLFLTGVAFGYFIIAPFGLSFLLGYQLPGVVVKPTLGSYMSYMVMLTLPIGIVFEMPVVAYFFSRIGLLTPETMKGFRRQIVVIILLVSGIITPSPDMVSQLLVAVPLYFLYEASIMVSRRVVNKMAAEEAAAEALEK